MPVTILDSRPLPAQALRATVLFVDLRGYTGLAERVPAPELVPMLEEFVTVLAAGVETGNGQVFHVAGDGLMAGFGTRGGGEHGAEEALRAAHSMLSRFAPIAARWRTRHAVETGIGIGIHHGEVALAMLGPPGRASATLLGDTVNVAARLCGRARAGEVLFSAAVAAEFGDPGAYLDRAGLGGCLRLPRFELRGRSAPLDIWCLPAAERLPA